MPLYKKALFQRSTALSKLENYKCALEDITALNLLNEFQNESDVLFARNLIERLGKKFIYKFHSNICILYFKISLYLRTGNYYYF